MGPYATQILGDMGADVIKVESREGDHFRTVAPARNAGMGATFLNLNRNKRSIVLDLKRDNDRRVLLDLLADADVFVSNVRPQSMRKLGLDYDSLRGPYPRLVYCGLYGFSEDGPYAGRPAYDDIIQAMSGLAVLQGHNDAGGPRYVNGIVADKTAALTGAYAIAMALFERERSGLGQAVEVPMFESFVAFNLVEHLGGSTFGPGTSGMGYERVLSTYRQPYRTRDGFIALLPYTQSHWQRFFDLAGYPEHAQDPRFMDPELRSRYVDEVYGVLARIVRERSTEEWFALLKDADIPVAPVLAPEELLADAHLTAVGLFKSAQHPTEGEIRTVVNPVKFSRTPAAIGRLAPTLGQHTQEILDEVESRKQHG